MYACEIHRPETSPPAVGDFSQTRDSKKSLARPAMDFAFADHEAAGRIRRLRSSIQERFRETRRKSLRKIGEQSRDRSHGAARRG